MKPFFKFYIMTILIYWSLLLLHHFTNSIIHIDSKKNFKLHVLYSLIPILPYYPIYIMIKSYLFYFKNRQ